MGVIRVSSTKLFTMPHTFGLKVSAPNFKDSEQSFNLVRCTAKEINVRLEQVNQLIRLEGVIYDPNGAVVPGVNVRTVRKTGESFQTTSSGEGKYTFKLLPGKYKIEWKDGGFEKLIVNRFELVNSTFGEMIKDVVLQPGPPNQ